MGLSAPGIVLLALFAIAPVAALLVSSFTADDGSVTMDNLAKVFASDTYLLVLGRTLLIAAIVVCVSIAIGWPAAWALARHTPPRSRTLILSLVIVPYITSQILLIYGFISLIQPGGPIMTVFVWLGISGTGESILYTPLANITMLVYESIPTVILVMYAASEQIDESLLDASRTLGSNRFDMFRRVVWPLSAPLLLVNIAITFVQTAGAFAEPGILGGPGGQMLGNTIASQVNSGVNRGFAVALSLVLLILSLLIVGAAGMLLNRRKSRSTTAVPVAASERI